MDDVLTTGHIPINLQDLPVDAFVFTGHKRLFGVPGTVGFYTRDQDAVAPVGFDGTGTDFFSFDHPHSMPERFEIGNHNYPGLAALETGDNFTK